MIEKTKSFIVTNTDGSRTAFLTIEEAQKCELVVLLGSMESTAGLTGDIAVNRTAEYLLANAERVVDILTTKGRKARKATGSTRKSKTPKPTAA